jgi:hypothetical protein
MDPTSGDFRTVGLPFGEKPRLILIHLTSEAMRTGSPVVEVEDSLTAYVRALGLPTSGIAIRTVKDQLARLAAATLRLAAVADGRAVQVNGPIIGQMELWAPTDPRQRVLWPSRVQLSDPYFASVQRHAVPLARSAIRSLAHSAMGLDLYSWLAQRLHRITPGQPQAVSWEALKGQFGPGYARTVDFRRKFRLALRSVLAVYAEARIHDGDDGLLLHHSPPPIRKRMTHGTRLPAPLGQATDGAASGG